MLIKRMKYKDFFGNEREEDFHFNLKDSEIIEMETSIDGGLLAMLQRIKDAQEIPEIAKVFKELILKAYGVPSPDGRRFTKSVEISKEFEDTQAFSDLYTELVSDANKAAQFFNDIIPDHNDGPSEVKYDHN